MAIDLNTIKKMPPKAQLGVVVLMIFLIGYFYWFFFLNSAMEQRSSKNTQLTEMQDKIKEKTKIAAQVKKFTADVAVLQNNYKTALQKLPDQREIPALFHSVSSAGRDAGVEFVSFEPKPSVPGTITRKPQEGKVSSLLKPSDQRAEQPAAAPAGGKPGAAPPPEPFYEEIPVGVSVTGTYQNILYFFDKVAKLSRIVNVSDISMNKVGDVKSKKNILVSTCTIKTYMFIDKKEKK